MYLLGEVIETVERDGERLVEIQLKPGFVEVSAAVLSDAHLGDAVVIDAGIVIKQLNSLPDTTILAQNGPDDPSSV